MSEDDLDILRKMVRENENFNADIVRRLLDFIDALRDDSHES